MFCICKITALQIALQSAHYKGNQSKIIMLPALHINNRTKNLFCCVPQKPYSTTMQCLRAVCEHCNNRSVKQINSCRRRVCNDVVELYVFTVDFASANFSHLVVGPLEGQADLPPFQKERSTWALNSIGAGVFTAKCSSWHQPVKKQLPIEAFHMFCKNFATLYERCRGRSFTCQMKFVHGTSSSLGPDSNWPWK